MTRTSGAVARRAVAAEPPAPPAAWSGGPPDDVVRELLALATCDDPPDVRAGRLVELEARIASAPVAPIVATPHPPPPPATPAPRLTRREIRRLNLALLPSVRAQYDARRAPRPPQPTPDELRRLDEKERKREAELRSRFRAERPPERCRPTRLGGFSSGIFAALEVRCAGGDERAERQAFAAIERERLEAERAPLMTALAELERALDRAPRRRAELAARAVRRAGELYDRGQLDPDDVLRTIDVQRQYATAPHDECDAEAALRRCDEHERARAIAQAEAAETREAEAANDGPLIFDGHEELTRE